MRSLSPSTSYSVPFSLPPEITASAATAYADTTSLGSATVAAGPKTNTYTATVSLPSNVTTGQVIRVVVEYTIDGEDYADWLEVGIVNLYAVQAAAVLAAAVDNPIHANVTQFLGEPAQPLDDVAKQETLLEVQAAVEAGVDLPEVEDVRAGVEYGGGLYVGVLDVGTGLPVPEYPPGSTGL